MNKELLKRMMREYFDTIDVRFRSDLQREDERDEVISLAIECELDPAFVDELERDARFKQTNN